MAVATRARTTPERKGEFAHLSLSALRTYRRALEDEEHRVSYWRRIIQARLDLVRAGGTGGESLTVDHVRRVLSEERVGRGRSALLAVIPRDDMPPLPDLASLWQRDPRPGDEEHNTRLEAALVAAERQLSDYRGALHARIDDATDELIARYRDDPGQCLTALPVDPAPARRAAEA